MLSLKELLDVLHESVDQSSPEEIKEACELIIRTQAMTDAERDVLRATYKDGPLWAGDLPSKSGRDTLMEDGFVEHVVVKGEDGHYACTSKGAWAYRLLEAGA